MTTVTTQLVVDASGALRVLDGFEQGMENAGKATEYASGAVASYEKRMAAANERIAKGQAVTTQRVESISKEEYAMRKLHAAVDPIYKLRIKLERDAAFAAVSAANAVSMGRETQEKALRTLMLLEQQHNAQLTAAINATKPAIAANDNLAQSYKRVAAANDNASHNVSNLAAQFQDIAVTSAMGMSPLQIALQQGTQISAVLGPMGAAGAIKGLGAAFLSIINPVSLVVIGLVAAAAAVFQYGSRIFDASARTKEASNSLEAHAAWLSDILQGYDNARNAATRYIEAAKTLPRDAVISDLGAERAKKLDEYTKELDKVKNAQTAFLQGYINEYASFKDKDPALQQAAALQALHKGLIEANLPLDQFISRMTEMSNDKSLYGVVRSTASELLDLAKAARMAKAEVESIEIAQGSMSQNTSGAFLGVSDGLKKIADMTPDLLTAREQVDAIFKLNIGQARTISEINALVEAYERYIDTIDRINPMVITPMVIGLPYPRPV